MFLKCKVIYLPWNFIIGSISSLDIPVIFDISSIFLPSLAIFIAFVIWESPFDVSANLDVSCSNLSRVYL